MELKVSHMGLELTYKGLNLTYMGLKLIYMQRFTYQNQLDLFSEAASLLKYC